LHTLHTLSIYSSDYQYVILVYAVYANSKNEITAQSEKPVEFYQYTARVLY